MIMSFGSSGAPPHHHKQSAVDRSVLPPPGIKAEEEETVSAAAAAAAAMQTAIKKHTIDAILGLPRLEDGGGGDGPARGGTALPPVLTDREPEGKFRHFSEINAGLNYYRHTVCILCHKNYKVLYCHIFVRILYRGNLR
jgi:hypothetical protein